MICYIDKLKERDSVMKLPLEEYAPYRLLALLVLIVFYGIYLAKAWIQKRRGIQTHQIGKRKEKSVHTDILQLVDINLHNFCCYYAAFADPAGGEISDSNFRSRLSVISKAGVPLFRTKKGRNSEIKCDIREIQEVSYGI